MYSIYTNENNPLALKLIVSAKLGGKNVEIVAVNLQDRNLAEPKHLPYLQLPEDRILFMSNAAARFLFPPQDSAQIVVDEFLEWESTKLSPTLAGFGGGAKVEVVKSSLAPLFKKLDAALANKKFLVNEVLTVADVVIWSVLYPVFIDSALKEMLASYSNVSSWIKNLESQDEFKKSTSEYKLSGIGSYSSLQLGAKYPSTTTAVSPESPVSQVSEAISPEELELAEKAWQKDCSSLAKRKDQVKTVLPIAGEKNVLITSALPYVNNVPHLGNIIGCVLSADVFARFCRMCNLNTLYVCGTDEYGTATETKALEEGLTCQQICDKYFKIHAEIYKWFNISFDHFGRTSTPHQTELCQEMFLTLNHNGFMFTEPVEQLHCESCNRYLADRFVEGGCPHPGCNYEDARGDQCDGCGKLVNAVELKNPRCKICSSTPKLKRSNQFFIDLPKLEPLLLHWMKKSSPGWSNNAQVIGKAWIREGLKPRCITRDLKWGVPVPLDGYRQKVFYVWFDAPIGYMSISKAYTEDWEKWWRPATNTDVTLYQFMAKDNVPFHAVMFPATLLGANKGYVTVSHIMATEYLNYEDGKFSKSRGIGVFGNDAQNTGIPSDVWRFYLLYVRPESQDSSFSWADLATKNNSELLNNLGNFVNRALVFAKNNFNRSVPEMKPNKDDYTILALCNREYKGYVASLEKAKLRDGIRYILSISRHGNQYMQSTQPWVLLKGSQQDKERAGTVIGICCNLACLLAALLHPYMPETSATLLQQLNTTLPVVTPDNIEIVNLLPAGHKLNEPSPLFAKIEPARVEELKKQFAGKQSENGKVKNDVGGDVASLEAAVAQQGNKVRELKSSGAGKDVWQPEVKILLELKKKLENAQKNGPKGDATQTAPVQNGVAKVDPNLAKQLEQEVEKQGALVRKLKESGSEKSVWQPEVEKLLQLKGKLAAASGNPLPEQKSKKKSKK